MMKYRLTIRTDRWGTHLCIGARDDADAAGKAAELIDRLGVPNARAHLTCPETHTDVPLPYAGGVPLASSTLPAR